MSILVGRSTRLAVQGLTGKEGAFHSRQMLEYGTQVVAGVVPGKGGTTHEGVPVFDSVEAAVAITGANTSCIFVPPAFAPDAIMEAAAAGIELIVCITEGIPALEMLKVLTFLERHPARLVGPNCPGVISPGRAKVGIMPGFVHLPGSVGVISRSGTLTYEAVGQLSALELGQSTCIGIGGDPLIGTSFVDALELFARDPETDAVVLIGEIGGNAEEQAAEFIRRHPMQPVVAFIAGRTAPPGKRMGHAGAIISGGQGTATDKVAALQSAGVAVVDSPAEIGAAVRRVLHGT